MAISCSFVRVRAGHEQRRGILSASKTSCSVVVGVAIESTTKSICGDDVEVTETGTENLKAIYCRVDETDQKLIVTVNPTRGIVLARDAETLLVIRCLTVIETSMNNSNRS